MITVESSGKYGYKVLEDPERGVKKFVSPEFNYIFNRSSGLMLSWGREIEDDPERSPVPNILDLEISTKCWKSGHEGYPSAGKHCPFCYKSNGSSGEIMSFETFKKILDVQSRGLTQIAFGSGFWGIENPEVFRMMDYAREKGIVPNITVGGVTDFTADEFSKRVGAIAISVYEDTKDLAYDSVKKMVDREISQTNIHFMISEETFGKCLELLGDVKTDPRLKGLNAVVLLSLKTKGRGSSGFTPLSQDKFDLLCKFALDNNIGLGFDSCSSLKASRALGGKFRESIIFCEASKESSYINVKGEYFPCSFQEGEGEWKEGLDVLGCKDTEDFLDKVWNHPKTLHFLKDLEGTRCDNCEKCVHCPTFLV